MKEELTYYQKKEWARELYTKLDKPVKDIALTVGADEVIVRSWAQEEGWDGVKRSLLTSRATQLEHLYSALEYLNTKAKSENGASPKDVDLILKYTSSIKNLEPEITVSNIIEVFEPFILWMRRRNADLTRKLIVHFDAFVKQKLAA